MSTKTLATVAATSTPATVALAKDDAHTKVVAFIRDNATPHPASKDRSPNGTASRIARLMNRANLTAPKGSPYWTRIEVAQAAKSEGIVLGD